MRTKYAPYPNVRANNKLFELGIPALQYNYLGFVIWGYPTMVCSQGTLPSRNGGKLGVYTPILANPMKPPCVALESIPKTLGYRAAPEADLRKSQEDAPAVFLVWWGLKPSTEQGCFVAFMTGWWEMVDINFWHFPMKILGFCHHPNWRTHIFQRGGPGPPTRWFMTVDGVHEGLQWLMGFDYL